MERSILAQIAQDFYSPAYVFELDELTQRLAMIREQLGGSAGLCYAMKANPFLVDHMKGLVDRFEVGSPGEFAICERNHIPAASIVLSGVNKERREIERVLNTYAGQIIFTVESEQQFQLLASCSQGKKETIKIILRLTSGNQFGMDEETIYRILNQLGCYPALELISLQYYSGTQKKKISLIERELKYLDEFCIKLQNSFQITLSDLEYGPGLYTPYFEQDDDVNDIELLTALRKLLENMRFGGKIMLEMGRYMTALCGYYITSVVDMKHNQDQNFCIIDGGINHVNYYGQTMAMKTPPVMHLAQEQNGKVENWHVCGSLCTAGDVIVKQLPLRHLSVNDILVFGKLGAYSITEGIYLFLSRDLPKVLFYNHAEGIQLVRPALATHTLNSII
ncbi:MAG TPA: alanine racemase [Bacillota bacterium]|nr:alanine racemase [Bacillota bacterium]